MQKPELLAPAGSLESFHAAVEAGANAVYLGVEALNARLRAKNFRMKTLAYLIPYAHSKGIKVYVTLNTLVKNSELKPLIDILFQLEQLKVDAVIVQDLGLAAIARDFFPKLPIHASTQAVIHNHQGAITARKMGFERVILSRELTFSEIEAIRKKTDIELEVFVHGALCYSISGLCLASSYLGGCSGNRGRCTQVCRRKMIGEAESGFYFSPRDFSGIEFIPQLSKAGISSLKIEGRMRSAEYVNHVVSCYRTAIDFPDKIPEIREKLKFDFGREKTPFFLGSLNQPDIITADRPAGTGISLGKISSLNGNGIMLHSDIKLQAGDRIRIHGQDGLEGKSSNLIKVEEKDKQQTLFTREKIDLNKGDAVYLISRKSQVKAEWKKSKIDAKPASYKEKCPFSQKILKSLKLKEQTDSVPVLWLKVDKIKWLNKLGSFNFDRVIFQTDLNQFTELSNNVGKFSKWKKKLVLELPAFIPEFDIEKWQDVVEKLYKNGFVKWMCNHLGQKRLFDGKNVELNADYPIWATNNSTRKTLSDESFESFGYSIEDDILNLKSLASSSGVITLFGYVPLFISRIDPPLPNKSYLQDNKKIGFFVSKKGGLTYLLGEKPVCLFHRQDKLEESGIQQYLIDLSFCEPNIKLLKTLIYHYEKKEKISDTTLFNHKIGFK